jgi:hypothetical protein
MVFSRYMGLLDSIRWVLGLRRKPRDVDELELDADDVEVLDEADADPGESSSSSVSGSFDFDRDIGRYFTAEFRIETATHDPVRRRQLFEEYDVQDQEHWQQIQAAFESWLKTPAAKAKYRTADDLMQARMCTTQTMTLADLGIARVNLEPIRGVTIEQWAKVEAAIEGGEPLRPLIAELRIDPETWAKVAAAWHQRMIDDVSGRIATEYMLHFRVRAP